MKQNEPDIRQVAIKVLTDWQRGNLPRFTLPPVEKVEEEEVKEEVKDEVNEEVK